MSVQFSPASRLAPPRTGPVPIGRPFPTRSLADRIAGARPARRPPPDRADADRVSRRDAEGRRDAEKNSGRGARPAARARPGSSGIQGPKSVGSESLRPSASLRETLPTISRRPPDRPVPLAMRPAWLRLRRSFAVPDRAIDRPRSYCANMNHTMREGGPGISHFPRSGRGEIGAGSMDRAEIRSAHRPAFTGLMDRFRLRPAPGLDSAWHPSAMTRSERTGWTRLRRTPHRLRSRPPTPGGGTSRAAGILPPSAREPSRPQPPSREAVRPARP